LRKHALTLTTVYVEASRRRVAGISNVHIADVPHYVRTKTLRSITKRVCAYLGLFFDAQFRCCRNRFFERHLLAESREDRLVMSCLMESMRAGVCATPE